MTNAKRAEQKHQLSVLNVGEAVNDACQNAKSILEYAHATASSLLGAYETIRGGRQSARGTTTDQEQDLLRAMLVMAAAGLDGMAKQLIRDTMKLLIARDETVKKGLETFIYRQMRGDIDLPEVASRNKLLARLLAAPSPQGQAIEEYIRALTGGSLQSAAEVLRIGRAFGLPPSDIGMDKENESNVQKIFDIRNKIIHELDMNLEGQQRKRNQRRVEDMKDYADRLLSIGVVLINKVSNKLAQ